MRSKCCKKKEILMVLGAAGVGEGLARKLTEGDLDKKKFQWSGEDKRWV